MAISNKDKAILLLLGIDEALLKGRGAVTRAVNLGIAATLRAAKAGLPVARSAAPPLSRLAMANPYTTGALLGGAALASPPGQMLLDVAAESGRSTRDAFDEDIERIIETAQRPVVRRKAKSKYNQAVSAAMKAVKASTKGGKKGTISNPKRVFSTVSKTVSKVARGKKPLRTGISGIAATAARKVLNRKPTYIFRKD